MKRFFKATLSLILALCLALPLTLGVLADSYVTQTAMVRALATTLQTEAPLDTEYTKKSPYGGAEGNLGFAQTFFYRLFLTELGGADLTQSTALTTISHFAAGDENAASTIPAARGALRFGDVIQYGPSGHISIVLGECEKNVVVLDCGYGEENGRVVRMRMVSENELKTQALLAGDRGGLYFFRSLNLPTADITLNLVTKPSSLSYYKEAAPSPHGALLEYYSQQTGKVEIKPDNAELKVFASTKEAGDAPMLFLYGSAITFCRLEVKNETVESVKIETMPTKLEYTTEEEVDMTGAVVTAKMLDGTTLTLTEADYTLTYAFTTPGSATVTLSYGGKSTTFAVAVKEPPVTKLTIVPPAKTTYYVGERLDLTGGSIVVDYEKEKNVTKEMLESMLST
ncbi:MAG: bacterial Ig-like domain-containing protein, partial [Clostridia bacterium]|nr:bacterial Ig-like domain-containing protein [Clostridia bacterium]